MLSHLYEKLQNIYFKGVNASLKRSQYRYSFVSSPTSLYNLTKLAPDPPEGSRKHRFFYKSARVFNDVLANKFLLYIILSNSEKCCNNTNYSFYNMNAIRAS